MGLTQVNTDGVKDDAVTLAKQAAGTDGQIITYDASGNPVAVGPGTDGQVLTSTGAGSPPAFETINIPAGVGGDTGVDFNDGVKARFGTGNDFEVLHDGTDSYLNHVLGSGLLRINAAAGAEIRLTKSGPETIAKFIPDGACELYYDNSKKFETTSGGATVTGDLSFTGDLYGGNSDKILLGGSSDLQIYHDGSHGYMTNTTGTMHLMAKGGENGIKITPDGSIELYFDNSKKLEVNNTGISVTGSVTPSSGIYLGGSGGSNYLSDYEEGSFTPADGGGIVSFSEAVGRYRKIGKLVIVSMFLRCNSNVTDSGNAHIVGLPFQSSNTDGAGHGGTSIGASNQSDNFNGGHMTKNSTSYYFYNTSYGHMTRAQMWDGDSTNKRLILTFSYFVD